MNNNKLAISIIVLGLVITFSPLFFAGMEVTGEQLCVDGNYNINLEGIMCEESQFLIGDFSKDETTLIILLFMVLGLIVYSGGLYMVHKGEDKW